MPIRLSVDTCVWLDLGKDYREQPVIAAVEDLVSSGDFELIVPQLVLDEFDRNKARIIEKPDAAFNQAGSQPLRRRCK
ncbi:PIN domain-containing protein [Paraburkholderia rhynchosiae]|uniref:DUF4935 domain-containing protein n=1 Tax=Paraburkholderia rhynchosiae TaxID=487049 RepID=A0A2N7W558_9BURK|nr:PIN domain-containing protein [Paraburkholderia rhynchosiae]PMS24533.1 hypothetical protein C0Z16_30970 [Paraburkholderia rhynchosiae]CAB3735571.1 hypothetical protein LMG27174_06216 [Paraburkholderia rhynchosiae]